MAKKLIILSDGTGNSAAKLFKTNVWKLYETLDLTPSSNQIALYDDGVGTSRFKPWALLTGAFGFGLKRNVLKMYVFLSRHYANEIAAQERADPNAAIVFPEIYAFGFSRGAYTVRVVSGLINHQRLLRLQTESEMRRLAKWAYRDYRRKSFKAAWHIERLRDLRDIVGKAWADLLGRSPYDDSKKTAPVKIRFLGVWDTVAAYGMPIEELRVAIDKVIFPLRFDNNKLAANVDCARHALSIDEERKSFAPVLWDDDPARVQQVWFAGVHSNVGGGYPDDSLSSTPLVWMIEEACKAGLKFDQRARRTLRKRTNPYGKMYDSRAGFGAFYRYDPRRLESTSAIVTVHESVVFRMATAFQGYAPIALPRDVCVSDKTGKTPIRFRGFQEAARGHSDRFASIAMANRAQPANQLAEMVARLQPPSLEATRRIRAAVLQRRFAYFGTLFPVLGLLGFPLLPRAFGDEPAREVLALVAQIFQSIMPGFLNPWLDAIVQFPYWALALTVVAVLSWRLSKGLKTLIAERARAAWNIGAPPGAGASANAFDAGALYLLQSGPLNAAWDFGRRVVFPTITLVGVLVLCIWLAGRLIFR